MRHTLFVVSFSFSFFFKTVSESTEGPGKKGRKGTSSTLTQGLVLGLLYYIIINLFTHYSTATKQKIPPGFAFFWGVWGGGLDEMTAFPGTAVAPIPFFESLIDLPLSKSCSGHETLKEPSSTFNGDPSN